MFRKLAVTAAAVALVGFTACQSDGISAPALSPASPTFAISFDPQTGIGSVGKGDIQQLLGLKNNAAAQQWYEDHGEDVEFKFRLHVKWLYDCVGFDNKDEPAEKDGSVTQNINAVPSFTGRGQSNWAGFTLTGLDKEGGNDNDAPVEGDACSEGNVDGVIENVTMATNPTPVQELIMKWGTTETTIPF